MSAVPPSRSETDPPHPPSLLRPSSPLSAASTAPAATGFDFNVGRTTGTPPSGSARGEYPSSASFPPASPKSSKLRLPDIGLGGGQFLSVGGAVSERRGHLTWALPGSSPMAPRRAPLTPESLDHRGPKWSIVERVEQEEHGLAREPRSAQHGVDGGAGEDSEPATVGVRRRVPLSGLYDAASKRLRC